MRLSKGNGKVGKHVITYSRAPIVSCPGASDACLKACYAIKAYRQYAESRAQWDGNAAIAEAPQLPKPKRNGERTLLRIHVSGDFDSVAYIESWIMALAARPDITAWGYTKSWRVAELLPVLERLRDLPNVQLMASIDASMTDRPDGSWRRAIMSDDPAAGGYACPEQSGRKPNCESCRFCFDGKRGDVRFEIH